MKKLPVVEIFDSIDGEGKRVGEMAIFIRLAGCNLRCSYCDTLYALSINDAVAYLTVEEIIKKVGSYPWQNITITGGEPLIHDIKELVDMLAAKGYSVNIETNGSKAVNFSWSCFYTIDYKCRTSGQTDKMVMDNFIHARPTDVIKFVVGSLDDLRQAEYIAELIPKGTQIYLSPVFGAITPAEIVDFIKESKNPRLKLQVQLHKIVWQPDMRGV